MFALELLWLSVRFDTTSISTHSLLLGLVAGWAPFLLRFFVAFITFYGILATRTAEKLRALSLGLASTRVSWVSLAGHFSLLALFFYLSRILFPEGPASAATDLVTGLWILTGVAAGLFGTHAFVPLQLSLDFVGATAAVAWKAAAAAILAVLLGELGDVAWHRATSATFYVVASLLRLFRADLVSDPSNLIIGTTRFHVEIVPGCSGLHGAGLMLAFTILWLWLMRRECRFPRAFVLIPAGVACAWVLNSVRIAALILIGDAGAEDIALGGFHSQAGWMMFDACALGSAFVLRRAAWLRKDNESATAGSPAPEENPTAWYLVPFLAIMAAAMVSQAAANGFEWLYPLRLVAAAAALWHFRGKYSHLDWRVGWTAAAIGLGVFAIWLGFDRLDGSEGGSNIAGALASLSGPLMASWIAVRVIAAAITVPIAEELAFRGYLMRRFVSADFETVAPQAVAVFAIVVSSLMFGILHGHRWLPGTAAGALYALAYRHRGRIGDAVAAHAITNASLAVWICATGYWSLW